MTRAQFVELVKKRFDAETIDMPYLNTELSGVSRSRTPPVKWSYKNRGKYL
jgi:hypothetical protein